jgi:methylglutaconyl-CoA hydratase
VAYETLKVEIDGRGVAQVSLARSAKRNAMSATMISELADVARTIGASRGTRAVVLSGEGPVFCSGADLVWMQAQIGADRTGRMAEARRLAGMLRALNEMPVPLIGRIHGDAFGGGLGLICICDVAVAAAGARFAFTETRLGLIPATISPYVLARIGEGAARRVFMSARVFDAAEAARLGMVAAAVPEEDLDRAVEAEVAPYLRVAPGAVGRAKALARSFGLRIDDAVIEASVAALADAWDSEEAAHGIASFLEKRPPRWSEPSDKG